MKIHIVQKGDTLWKIAKKYGVNFEELKKMNSQLSNPDMIMPGMKIKVPATGGMVKKEAPVGPKPEAGINLGVKKEVPIAKEKPIAKEIPIAKEVPIIKEKPIIKEAPKAPITPKMPLTIVPEIDINNYYMSNMTNIVPELPPKPVNILPEVKEVPKKEVPIKEIPKEMPIKSMPMKEMPMKEIPKAMPIEMPQPVYYEQPQYCMPVTSILPGSGFCPPYDPCAPYPGIYGEAYPGAGVSYPSFPEAGFAGTPGYTPAPTGFGTVPGMAPHVAGASYLPPHFSDESSSFMPQMPMTQAGFGAHGFGQPSYTSATPYPTGFEQMPMGYQTAPTGYQEAQMGFPAAPMGYSAAPMGFQAPPMSFPTAPMSFPTAPMGYPEASYGTAPTGYPIDPGMGAPYGQAPYGYPMGGGVPQGMGPGYESAGMGMPVMGAQPFMHQPYMTSGLPVGTGAMGDCGCGPAPVFEPMPTVMPNAMPNVVPNAAPNLAPNPPVQQSFVPPTPPIFSAPYTGVNVAQPPFMNPYGMTPGGAYGMTRYIDESND